VKWMNLQEETESGAVSCGGFSGDEAAKRDDHGDHLASCTNEEQLASAQGLNSPEGHKGESGVNNHVHTTQ